MVHNVCLAHVANVSLHATQVRSGPPSVPQPHSAVSHGALPQPLPPELTPRASHARGVLRLCFLHTPATGSTGAGHARTSRCHAHGRDNTRRRCRPQPQRRCRPQAPSSPVPFSPCYCYTCSQFTVIKLFRITGIWRRISAESRIVAFLLAC